MKFKAPLHVRMRRAANASRRYWGDPERRVRRVNEHRAARGLPLVSSVDEIMSPAERGSFIAAKRQRDERGRLV